MQIITTRIEHPSVTKAFLAMKKRGVTVDFIAVDEQGQVVKEKLQSVLSAQTTLVSIAYANSEIGTVQSLHHIKKIIKAAETKFDNKILLHVDAAQAPLWLNCQFDSLGADLVSLDFAKCGGPKGVGALLRNHHVQLSPVLHGGGQEDGLRPGTENVLGIVGGAAAFAAAQASYKDRSTRVSQVRDGGIEILGDVDERVMLNGAVRDKRIANNINISIPGIDTEFLTVWLDSKGFAVSTKSACAGAGGGESTVVREISKDPARAQSTLRITLGPDSTTKQIEALALEMKNHFAIQSELTEK